MDNNIDKYGGLLPGEPIIMPWQAFPFNGDAEICAEFLRLRDEFEITIAVELGSAVGGTTKWLGENFEEVFTIEINEVFWNICLDRTKKSDNVISAWGDTLDVLPEFMELLDSKTIFFIDSHWGNFCPLEKELEIIASSGLKPCLAIHDFQVPGHPEFGFDEYNDQPFTFEWLKPHFDKIYGEDGYDHYYNTGIVENSAKRGIIYLTPKKFIICQSLERNQ